MAYQNKVLSIDALLHASRTVPEGVPSKHFGVPFTATENAMACRHMLADGEALNECWRFGILQTLDDYTSTLRRGGPELASQVFTQEPPAIGAPQLDAAFAALADYLAVRDGWTPPAWVMQPGRCTEAWYPAVPTIFRAEAEAQSPDAFRRRGIYITSRSLERA